MEDGNSYGASRKSLVLFVGSPPHEKDIRLGKRKKELLETCEIAIGVDEVESRLPKKIGFVGQRMQAYSSGNNSFLKIPLKY